MKRLLGLFIAAAVFLSCSGCLADEGNNVSSAGFSVSASSEGREQSSAVVSENAASVFISSETTAPPSSEAGAERQGSAPLNSTPGKTPAVSRADNGGGKTSSVRETGGNTVSQTPAPASSGDAAVSSEPISQMVWISEHGTKYHRNSRCSNMKNPWQVTKEQAVSQGREPCKKCYGR